MSASLLRNGIPGINELHIAEVLTLVSSIRIFWTHVVDSRTPEARMYPLVAYVFIHPVLVKRKLMAEMEGLRLEALSEDLKLANRATVELSDVVLRYNVFASQNRIWQYMGVILSVVLLLKFFPLIAASILISDLVTTRVHQHILRSFI
jgi:hypothetical protein